MCNEQTLIYGCDARIPIYAYTRTYRHKYAHTPIAMHINVNYLHRLTNIDTYTHKNLHKCTDVQTSTRTYIKLNTSVHTPKHEYRPPYIHLVHTHINLHTHVHAREGTCPSLKNNTLLHAYNYTYTEIDARTYKCV